MTEHGEAGGPGDEVQPRDPAQPLPQDGTGQDYQQFGPQGLPNGEPGDGAQYGPYGGQPYGGQPYGGQPYGGQPYGGGEQYGPYAQQYGQYGGEQYGGQFWGQQYGGQPYGGQQYGGQPYGGGQYGQFGPYGQQYWGQYGGGPYGPAQVPGAQLASPARSRRRRVIAIGAGVVAAATVIGVTAAATATQTTNGTAVTAQGGSGTGATGNGSSGGGAGTIPTFPGPGNSTGNGTNGGNSSGSRTGKASTAQQVGVVDIYTVQKYNQAAAAGTGMVLTSNGEILTNNHVIDGSTSIKIRVVSTGRTYVAKVVGTSPTRDIAVLQAVNASGLAVANLGDSASVSVGDAVTGVGNAGGTGGVPSAASGKVLAIGKTITASDESGANAEKLHGVIVTDAPIRSGDSGGPLYDAAGEIVGIDTAASTTGPSRGFAIPIDTALSIAAQIEKGVETSSIHIGYPGFLGISVGQSFGTRGAAVAGVLRGGAAAKAGLSAGDVITSVGNTSIADGTQLKKIVSAEKPGSTVSVTYTDPQTGRHTVSVTLGTGPAD